MSYIPTEWKTGDIVTAEKLNKLEEGVASGGGGGGGALILHTIEDDEYVYLDKTAAEIIAAMPLVYVEIEAPLEGGAIGNAFLGMYVNDVPGYSEKDGVYFFNVLYDSIYSADSLNERPKYSTASPT